MITRSWGDNYAQIKERQSPSAARVIHTGGTELNTINTYIAMSVQTGRKRTSRRRIDIQIAEVLDSECPDAIDSGAAGPDDQTALPLFCPDAHFSMPACTSLCRPDPV